MSMSEFVLGAAVGAGLMIAKEQFIDKKNDESADDLKRQLDSLSNENEKLRKRIKDAERQIEDLVSENQKLKKSNKSSDDEKDDLEDDLEDAKAKIKKLIFQNEELIREIQQYKDACANYENEIKKLKA